MAESIAICSNRAHDEPTPLVPTMAFNGAEYWCALCGATSGMFGVSRTPATPALRTRLGHLEDLSRPFLRARGRLVATRTLHAGEWVKPADLPAEVKAADAEILRAWRYEEP